jgi:hypothetical protein
MQDVEPDDVEKEEEDEVEEERCLLCDGARSCPYHSIDFSTDW